MRLHQPTVQELQNALASAKTCVSKIEEALGTTGKPGSGPEFPPEGYRLARPGEFLPFIKGLLCWAPWRGRGWEKYCSHGGPVMPGQFIAVPLPPKPEPVKLSDQEKMVGWRGPTGFRLQTFQNRDVQCAVCKKTIKAGERLARWRHRFPEQFDGFVHGKDSSDDHSHAHVDCLFHVSKGGMGSGKIYPCLDYSERSVPQWLRDKRNRWHEQQITP